MFRIPFVLYLISIFHSVYSQDVFMLARNGRVSDLRQLARQYPDTLSATNVAGFTPLVIAAYHGQDSVVAFLVGQKVDVNYNTPEGTALMSACYQRDKTIVRLLLKKGANVNQQNPVGTTALIFAVLNDDLEMVKILLDAGANKDLKDSAGKNALMHANVRGVESIIHLLSH